jgi:hypothetical protein
MSTSLQIRMLDHSIVFTYLKYLCNVERDVNQTAACSIHRFRCMSFSEEHVSAKYMFISIVRPCVETM